MTQQEFEYVKQGAIGFYTAAGVPPDVAEFLFQRKMAQYQRPTPPQVAATYARDVVERAPVKEGPTRSAALEEGRQVSRQALQMKRDAAPAPVAAKTVPAPVVAKN